MTGHYRALLSSQFHRLEHTDSDDKHATPIDALPPSFSVPKYAYKMHT